MARHFLYYVKSLAGIFGYGLRWRAPSRIAGVRKTTSWCLKLLNEKLFIEVSDSEFDTALRVFEGQWCGRLQAQRVLAVTNGNWNDDDTWNVYANRFDNANEWNAENVISFGN